MQLDPYHLSAIPTPLYDAGFRLLDLQNNISVCYKQRGNVHMFVHHALDLFPSESLANHIQNLLDKRDNNNLCTELVYFYCARRPDKEFVALQKYDNFTYCCVPLIALGQVGLHLDLYNLPDITEPNKSYCYLSNRNTPERVAIYDFLVKENLVHLGYVSFRDRQDDGTIHSQITIGSETFRNFDDPEYNDDYNHPPRSAQWYFPQQDFLFDFNAETFQGEKYPWLSEKGYKGFLWGKIVVSLGQQGMMHYLESLGFDIYRDIVDFTYDLQHESHVRQELFCKEIKRLATTKVLPDVIKRAYKNRQHFVELHARCNQILSAIDQDIDVELIRGF